ncbi:MAG TPA: hypothetical protein ENK02_04455 [Planctomycetes bacterium]|nr:hypothetical protein [Planctomycetota bacterium]
MKHPFLLFALILLGLGPLSCKRGAPDGTPLRVLDAQGKPVPGMEVQLLSSSRPGFPREDRVVVQTGRDGQALVRLQSGRSYTAWGLKKDDRGKPLVQTEVLEDVVAGAPILLRTDLRAPKRFPLRVAMLHEWKDYAPIRLVARSLTKNSFAFPLSLDSRGRCLLPVIPGRLPRIEFSTRAGAFCRSGRWALWPGWCLRATRLPIQTDPPSKTVPAWWWP